jgi:hypothetical protein
VAYVKPHGALYNDMMADPRKLRAVLEAVAAYDSNLPLMLMATADNSAAQALGDEIGVPLWFEAFADRAYTASGHLVSRRLPGAVHHDPALVVEQALRLARGEHWWRRWQRLRLQASTLCVHGDNDSSVAAVRQIRQALDALERHEAAHRSGGDRQPDGAPVRPYRRGQHAVDARRQPAPASGGEHLLDLVPSYTTLMVQFDLAPNQARQLIARRSRVAAGPRQRRAAP